MAQQQHLGAVRPDRTDRMVDTGIVDVTTVTSDRGVLVSLTELTISGGRSGDTITITEDEMTRRHLIRRLDELYREVVADLVTADMATVTAPSPVAAPVVDPVTDWDGAPAGRLDRTKDTDVSAGYDGRPFRLPDAPASRRAAYPSVHQERSATYGEAGDAATNPTVPRAEDVVDVLPAAGRHTFTGMPVGPDGVVAGRVDEGVPDLPMRPYVTVQMEKYDGEEGNDVDQMLTYDVPASLEGGAVEALEYLIADGAIDGTVSTRTYTVSERFETRDGEIREPGETVESYFVDLDGMDMGRTEFFVDGDLAADPIDAYDDATRVTFVEADRFAGDDDADYCGGLDIDDVVPRRDPVTPEDPSPVPAAGGSSTSYGAS